MKPDPTNHDRPVRRFSDSKTPITEPAPSGFFLVRDTLGATLMQWVIALALIVGTLLLVGCGPSEVHAARAIADDKQAAENAARRDTHTLKQGPLGAVDHALRLGISNLRRKIQTDHSTRFNRLEEFALDRLCCNDFR